MALSKREVDARYRSRHLVKMQARERERSANRRADWGARIDAIKLASGCVDCGYREHACALDFDHVDRATKVESVSQMVRLCGWKAIEAEMAKCEVRCANCHRVKTRVRG